MTSKDNMTKKFDNLDDIDLSTNLLVIMELAKKWSELRKDNKEVKQLKEAILKISVLVSKLTSNRENYHLAMSEYKSESLRMTERARRAEERIKALEEEVAIYKRKEQLGL